jgi:hypothetical protein
MPDHMTVMQAATVLVYAFLAGFGWNFGNWVAGKVHK